MVFGSAVNQFAALAGLMAASIAIGGFLAHAQPALAGEHESELRRATVAGGLYGLAVATLLTAISIVLG
jgi:hypothetical protein